MTRFVLTCATFVLAAPVPAADPAKPAAVTFDGKVMPLADALKKLGARPDADTTGVALVAADGTVYTLVKDEKSRLLFLDKQLHNREVRLTARVLPGTQTLKVEKVQTVAKGGKVFDVDYWCENCQLAAAEPGKCMCCGADLVLRERPVK